MKTLSAISCAEYRTLIEKETFISYFRCATPELVCLIVFNAFSKYIYSVGAWKP
jgi:hypothetical protein